MRDDELRERIRVGLDVAAKARVAGLGGKRLEALEDAWDAATQVGDPSLLAGVCWRLAKARFDEGVNDRLLDALEPLLDDRLFDKGLWGVKQRVGPFDLYPAGARALEPLCRRHWDHQGYGDARVEKLWEAWIGLQRAAHDPFLVAWGHIQLAWAHAATGRLADVDAVTQRYARMDARTFGSGPTRHGRALDGSQNVAWVQLDLARTLLRVATWQHQERAAWEAYELLEDAGADAGLERQDDPWFLDAILRAAGRFGWDAVVSRDLDAYETVIGRASLTPAHRARMAAWAGTLHGRDEAEPFVQAAEQLTAQRAGPEWVVEAWLDAARLGAPGAAGRAREEAARTGVSMAALRAE